MLRKPFFLLVTGMVACSGDQSVDGDAYTIVDSAGVRIVESLSPTWGEDGRRIDPEPFLRIGEVEGEEPYQFGQLWGGVLLADGHIVASDGLAMELRVFDSTGRHVNTFGQAGAGPGEFRSLGFVSEYRGDSIAAFDRRLHRTSVFSRSSGLARTVQNQVEGNFVVFGFLRDGPFLLFNPGQFRPELQQGLHWDSTDVVAMDLSGRTSEVVIRLPVLERLIGPAGRRHTLMLPGVSIRAVAEDGFYWATSDRYEITFYDTEGQVRRILRRHVQPLVIDESMKAEYKAAMLAVVRRIAGEEAARRDARRYEDATYTEIVPLFGFAFVDGDHRLWVSEWPFPVASVQNPPRRWSVFSPEGMWLGDLEAPERLLLVDSRGDTVLGIWRDDLDVQYLQLHRLIGG